VKRLTSEPSASHEMRHRLPGSFENGKRRQFGPNTTVRARAVRSPVRPRRRDRSDLQARSNPVCAFQLRVAVPNDLLSREAGAGFRRGDLKKGLSSEIGIRM
jgi:hypothetical protein